MNNFVGSTLTFVLVTIASGPAFPASVLDQMIGMAKEIEKAAGQKKNDGKAPASSTQSTDGGPSQPPPKSAEAVASASASGDYAAIYPDKNTVPDECKSKARAPSLENFCFKIEMRKENCSNAIGGIKRSVADVADDLKLSDADRVKQIDKALQDVASSCKPHYISGTTVRRSDVRQFETCFATQAEKLSEGEHVARCQAWATNPGNLLKQASLTAYERYVAITDKQKADMKGVIEQANSRDLKLGFKSVPLFIPEADILKGGNFKCQKKSARLTVCTPNYETFKSCRNVFVPAYGASQNVCENSIKNLAGPDWNSIAGVSIDVTKSSLVFFDGKLVRMHIAFAHTLNKTDHEKVVEAFRERYGPESFPHASHPSWQDKNSVLGLNPMQVNIVAAGGSHIDEHERLLKEADKTRSANEAEARKNSETRLRAKDL